MEELVNLKKVLRSLVVSSPTQIDVRRLLIDYKEFEGKPLPYDKYGYRNAVQFLQEHCSDCFLGLTANPTLILIVTPELKHIDEHVRKQKPSASKKFKPKRASVSNSYQKPRETLIAQSHKDNIVRYTAGNRCAETPNRRAETPYRRAETPDRRAETPDRRAETPDRRGVTPETESPAPPYPHHHTPTPYPKQRHEDDIGNHQEDGNYSRIHLDNFLRKRNLLYDNSQHLDAATFDDDSCRDTSDSGRQTASSGGSSSRRGLLEELKAEVTHLVQERPDGVLCGDVVQLYRERFGRELELARCGLTSVMALLEAAPRLRLARGGDGEWRARCADAAELPPRAPAAPAAPHPPPRAAHPPPRAPRPPVDADDALPGVDFDPDVFPADCMHFMESVPALGAAAFAPGEMAGVAVGEVYSPSHFWLIRLGDEFNIAMENMMDEMNEYYTNGPGKDRVIALGAVRPGHYCASVYDGDWHRSIIVRALDCDTVKVRHVDYGTVERVGVERLRPLLRRWAELPAQAVRARLAGVRPGAGGRRWPPAAAAAFLQLVRDKHLVASVIALDTEEDVVEVVLVDTTTDEDVLLGEQLVRHGHADARADTALRTSECYLFPRFEALETGATPNYAEIHAYLRDGIALECVEEYRRHVPAALPPLTPLAPPAPRPPSPPPAPRRAEAATSPSPPPAPALALSMPMLTRVPLLCGVTASYSDKAIQLTPPPASPPASPPAPCVSLIDLSPPPSPPGDVAHRSPLIPTKFLVNSFDEMKISPAPATAASSTAVSSSAVTVFPFAASVVSSAPAAPSPAVTALSPAAAAFSPAAAAFPFASHQYGHPPACPPGATAHAYADSALYRQPPPRFLTPLHTPYPLTYPVMLAPQVGPPPPAYLGPFPPRPPAPPPPAGEARRFRTPGGGDVTLSAAECEIFRLLSRMDPHAAHCYMEVALSRAMGARGGSTGPAPAPAPLNPHAREFRHPGPPAERVRPPPGFEDRR